MENKLEARDYLPSPKTKTYPSVYLVVKNILWKAFGLTPTPIDAKLLKGHLVEGDGPANSIKKEKFGGRFNSVPYWLHPHFFSSMQEIQSNSDYLAGVEDWQISALKYQPGEIQYLGAKEGFMK